MSALFSVAEHHRALVWRSLCTRGPQPDRHPGGLHGRACAPRFTAVQLPAVRPCSRLPNPVTRHTGTAHSSPMGPATAPGPCQQKSVRGHFSHFLPVSPPPAPPQIRVGVDQCCYRGKRWKSGSRRKQLLFSLYCMLTEYVIAAIWGAGQPTRPHACGTSSVCTDVSPAMTGFTRPDAEGHRSPSFPPPHLHCACCPDRSLKCSLGAGRCR